MSPEFVGIIGIVVLLLLLFSRMWIGGVMAFVGVFGFAYLRGFEQAMGVLSTIPYETVANYALTVLPLFILMGNIVSETGVGSDLYKAGDKWMGSLPGGLAMGTIGACAGFAAVSGTSLGSAITMGKVAMPEMGKFKYSQQLSTGSVSAGASLGVLIPPSMGFIMFSVLTEEPVGKLFIAGIIPGILLAISFMLVIYIMAKRNPELGPAGLKTSFKQKLGSLKYTWAILFLFSWVIGGIYIGIFTPSEAGAIGAFGALVITLAGRRLTWKRFKRALLDAGELTAMIMLLIIGAMLFTRFLAVTKLPFLVSDMVAGLDLPRYAILAGIIIFYILCGMFLDIHSAIILTVPILFPTMVALQFDPIWFGVLVVLLGEIGLITPPMGMNVFILSGVSEVPLNVIFRGVLPFVAVMMVFIIIMTIFPQIALFLPNLM